MGDPAGTALRVGATMVQAVTGLRHPRRLARRLRRRWRARGQVPTSPPEHACLVCRSSTTRVLTVEKPKRAYQLTICKRCGYVSNATNTVDYTQFQSVKRFELTARVGTKERPGREFHMATMGVQVLGREGLRVNVFGAGRSLDYLHTAPSPASRGPSSATWSTWGSTRTS